jgi:hypothetical protein
MTIPVLKQIVKLIAMCKHGRFHDEKNHIWWSNRGDRAALDVAIKFKIPHGGWLPRGRKTEDGPLP